MSVNFYIYNNNNLIMLSPITVPNKKKVKIKLLFFSQEVRIKLLFKRPADTVNVKF